MKLLEMYVNGLSRPLSYTRNLFELPINHEALASASPLPNVCLGVRKRCFHPRGGRADTAVAEIDQGADQIRVIDTSVIGGVRPCGAAGAGSGSCPSSGTSQEHMVGARAVMGECI